MGKSSGNQKVTQQTKLPAWYETGAKDAISFSNNAAENLMKPYSGNTVAALDPLTQQAIGLTGQNIGSTNAAFDQAGRTAAGVAGYQPGSFLTGNIDAYMNPYLRNVEQAALGNMDRAYRQNLNTIADGAISAGAFGGSRQGVAEGVAAAENARQMGDLSAQLRAQGYGQAQGIMQSDLDRAMQGQQLNLQAAGQQGALASAGQQAYLQSLQSALAGGQINQAQAQALLDQQKAQYDAERNYPLEQLNIKLAGLGGVQVPTTTVQKTPTTGSPLGTAIGAGLSALPVIGGAANALGGLASGAGPIYSDENAKTNLEPLGIDGMTGMPIYAYDYKSDVERARRTGAAMPPKRVGPMAQDMPPEMTGMVGNRMVIKGLI